MTPPSTVCNGISVTDTMSNGRFLLGTKTRTLLCFLSSVVNYNLSLHTTEQISSVVTVSTFLLVVSYVRFWADLVFEFHFGF